LVLIGRAGYHVRRVIDALQLMGKLGLGQERGRCILEQIRPAGRFEMESTAVHCTGSLRRQGLHAFRQGVPGERSGLDVKFSFLTSLRLKHNGKFVSDLEFHHIVRSLLRRVSAMAHFHCALEAGNFNFGDCVSQAEGVRAVDRDVRWKDRPKCSRRYTQKCFWEESPEPSHSPKCPSNTYPFWKSVKNCMWAKRPASDWGATSSP